MSDGRVRLSLPSDGDSDECDGPGKYFIDGVPRPCICSEPQTDDKEEARAARLADDYQALKSEDFDVGALNPGAHDARASKDKKQEYSKLMGQFARALGAGELSERDAAYIATVAEQERRFGNRRTARTVSLTAANEALTLRNFRAAAEQYLADKITPTGYAVRESRTPRKRSVVLLLSDLHIGAELSELNGDPVTFRAVQEARRLEYVVRQAVDFKPQYRDQSELVLILAGDMIEGLLLHDLRDGAPLTEQMVAFWKYFQAIVGLFAHAFPSVRVVCQPGNHGRNVLRHPGRATSSKWDGVEWQLYYGLKMMASSLPNVTFDLGFRAISVVDLHGSNLGVTHGDTEIKLGHPHLKAAANAAILRDINATRLYGVEFAAWVSGHYHTPAYQPGTPAILANGMLVPPNGHARTSGYITERCGQWLWEAVEGFPIGDLRYVEVGKAQDEDEQLGNIVQPFRLAGSVAA